MYSKEAVIPAKAGIHLLECMQSQLDSRLRGNDVSFMLFRLKREANFNNTDLGKLGFIVTIQYGKVAFQIAADLFKIKEKKRNVLPVREYFSTQGLGKSVVS